MTWTDDNPEDTILLRAAVRRPPRYRPRRRPRLLQVFLGYPGRHARKARAAWA